jgi:Domain of unknown function (DUF4252)
MKRFLFFAIWLLCSATNMQAQDDAITKYFTKYAEDERFTVVYVSPKMFQMIAKISSDDPDWQKAKDVLKDISGLRIIAVDNDDMDGENGQKIVQTNRINGHAMYKEAMNTLNGRSYDELLTVRDGQQNVRIMTRESGSSINELLLLVGEPDSFVMLSFTGRIDLERISGLGNSLNIQGAEHLGKIKSKN